MIIISEFLAMGAGLTLLMYGLATGDAGVVATPTATIPVLILPLLLVNNRIRTPFMSWIGEVVTVLGIALITIAWN